MLRLKNENFIFPPRAQLRASGLLKHRAPLLSFFLFVFGERLKIGFFSTNSQAESTMIVGCNIGNTCAGFDGLQFFSLTLSRGHDMCRLQ